jgi:hypothetical protein
VNINPNSPFSLDSLAPERIEENVFLKRQQIEKIANVEKSPQQENTRLFNTDTSKSQIRLIYTDKEFIPKKFKYEQVKEDLSDEKYTAPSSTCVSGTQSLSSSRNSWSSVMPKRPISNTI